MKYLISLLLFALIAGKCALIVARGPAPIERDALGYWQLSTLVMDGDVLMLSVPIAYRTPGYPWFLAAFRYVAAHWSLLAVVVAQAVLYLGSLWLAAGMMVRITRLPGARMWTMLLGLPAVSAITYSTAVLSESLFMFLLVLHCSAVVRYVNEATTDRAIWAGITYAAALLTRPIVMFLWVAHLILIASVYLMRRRRMRKKMPPRFRMSRQLSQIGTAALVITVLVAPWLARNQILFGDAFLTEFLGRNLWVVTFQDGSGAGLDLPENDAAESLRDRLQRTDTDDWRATWTVSLALVRSGLNDAQADRLMAEVAFAAIVDQPQRFAYKAIRRIVNYWRCAATDLPSPGAIDLSLGQRTWGHSIPAVEWAISRRASQFVWINTLITVVLCISCLTLLVHRPSRPFACWMILIFAYFSVVTGILEIPHYRYRMVLEPLMTACIGGSIAVLFSRRQRPAQIVSAG